MRPITIVLADDHKVIRDGLKALLGNNPGYHIVGEASTGHEAVEKVGELKPDILLMDISMPGHNGMHAASVITRDYPKTRVIILSMHHDIEHISRCLESDVMGYVVKTDGGNELVKAIESVAAGKKFYSEAVRRAVVEKYAKQQSPGQREGSSVELTAREREIMQFIAQGWTNQRIADKLFISFRTVETHRANLMRKLEAKNSIELVNTARKLGIVR